MSTSSPNASSLFQDLQARTITYQVTDPSIEKHMDQGPITLYCGFDPTADSLHVGSLFPLLTLKRFQDAGHRPIVVLGGATGMIGDPSFKSTERVLQTPEQVAVNLAGIKKVASKFLDFTPGKKNAAVIIDNNEFYKTMGVLEFLREVGKHFTVNSMVSKDSVRSRMEDREQGISYTEFSYSLLQAYDFYCLYKQFNCTVQIGASDQWGNIVAGTELIRRKLAHETPQTGTPAEHQAHAFGYTHPLITRSDGLKFGKSESGTIWLSSEKTSAYQLYQFFISAPDDRVITWLNYLTFIATDDIKNIAIRMAEAPGKKEAQLTLARAVTELVHGQAALERAEKATQALFGTEIKELDLQTLNEIFAETPSTTRARADLTAGIPLIDLLVETGLFQSKGAARKEIPAGGVYLNNERIADPAFMVTAEHLIAQSVMVLRKGKKNYNVVKFS
jgi:tyrosyl-tRNA synthetase